MPHNTYYPEPRISRFLFASKVMAVPWAILRIYLGWLWLRSGLGKITDPAWIGTGAGAGVRGYLQGALARSTGEDATVSGWYAWLVENVFLPNATLFSNLVALGETFIGLALILGFLTGLSAFLGGLLNATFLFAGTLSSNPLMFILATWLVLAWRVAGYYGLDYWVLPKLGAPHGFGSRQSSPQSGSAPDGEA